MNRLFKLGASAGLAVAAVVLLSTPAFASSDKYNFTVRGIVTKVDRSSKTVTVYTTHASPLAQDDLAGETIEFNAAGAKFYKYDAKLKKIRTTIGNVPVQSEVVLKGAKRGEDRFNISELTVNPSTFSIVGSVQGQNTGNKTITVNVLTSTYKEAKYKGEDLVVYYGNNTTFRNAALNQINSDELANNQERVKITGTITNGNKFEVLTLIDGYSKTK